MTIRTIPPPPPPKGRNVEALPKNSASFTGNQHYVVLVMDGMKTQSDLVFDKNSGDLVGFMDLCDPMTNFACLDDKDIIATMLWHFLLGVYVPMLNKSLHISLQEMSLHTS